MSAESKTRRILAVGALGALGLATAALLSPDKSQNHRINATPTIPAITPSTIRETSTPQAVHTKNDLVTPTPSSTDRPTQTETTAVPSPINKIIPNGAAAIDAPPSVSESTLAGVYALYGSPLLQAKVQGYKNALDYLYKQSIEKGIDPNIPGAIGVAENHGGALGQGPIKHTLCDLPTQTGMQQRNGLRAYSTWKDGINNCLDQLITDTKKGYPTLIEATLYDPAWKRNFPQPLTYAFGITEVMRHMTENTISGFTYNKIIVQKELKDPYGDCIEQSYAGCLKNN